MEKDLGSRTLRHLRRMEQLCGHDEMLCVSRVRAGWRAHSWLSLVLLTHCFRAFLHGSVSILTPITGQAK